MFMNHLFFLIYISLYNPSSFFNQICFLHSFQRYLKAMEVSPPLPILILSSPPSIIFGLHVVYTPSSSCPSLLHAAAFPNSLLHRSLELPHFSVTSLLPKCSNLYALILALTPFCTLRRLQAVSAMPMHCLPLLISCMLVVIIFLIKL